MKHLPQIFSAIFLVFILSYCSDDDMVTPVELTEDSTIVAYLASVENHSFEVDENGIYSYPIELSSGGTNAAGNVLAIYYSVSLLDGTIIDEYDEDDGDPILMRQGVNAIYPVGLDLALPNMNEGDTYGFVIPSALAYDTVSFASIPTGSIVEFEVELVEVNSEEGTYTQRDQEIADYIEILDDVVKAERQAIIDDIRNTYPDTLSSTDSVAFQFSLDSLDLIPLDTFNIIGSEQDIYYKVLEGEDLTTGSPGTGQLIGINYEGRFVGTDTIYFDQRYNNTAFEYDFNSNFVIPGLDIGVAEMQFGQTSAIVVPPDLAYRESAVVVPAFLAETAVESNIVPDYILRVGPYESLIFEVTLRNAN